MKYHTPALSPEDYLQLLVDTFTEAGDPARAEQQRAYMRHQFEFCGLGAPQWLALSKDLFASYGLYSGKTLERFVRLCFEQEYREVHYAGLEMMQRMLSVQPASWIRVLEKCITNQSWWDTVDWLAKLSGVHVMKYPEQQEKYAYRWIESGNIWLQRVAIIHQLHYKEKTNEKLLFAMIRRRADSKEFFIQKACGWALRQHAKIDPDAVLHFLEHQPVSKLTFREAMKHIGT
jgi:3-methyladenine DNA glycosylase AlkD